MIIYVLKYDIYLIAQRVTLVGIQKQDLKYAAIYFVWVIY